VTIFAHGDKGRPGAQSGGPTPEAHSRFTRACACARAGVKSSGKREKCRGIMNNQTLTIELTKESSGDHAQGGRG